MARPDKTDANLIFTTINKNFKLYNEAQFHLLQTSARNEGSLSVNSEDKSRITARSLFLCRPLWSCETVKLWPVSRAGDD